MIQELLNRYTWIVETLSRYKRLTRRELDSRWKASRFSVNGEGLPRRTFYNYRQAIEEIFGLEIKYNPETFEYYIEQEEGSSGASVVEWLLNSDSTNNVLSGARDIADRILLEDVPSAREHLATVMEAVKTNQQLEFEYAPYTRARIARGVTIEPYFLNMFKQRWYVTGRNVAEDKIKTYALDRMRTAKTLSVGFSIPEDFDLKEYTRNAFGVIFSQGPIYDVVLRVNQHRANYLRTVPLHHSQKEELYDSYSLFSFRVRLTPDFISEILSFGSSVTVVQPAELRLMVTEELRKTLDNY